MGNGLDSVRYRELTSDYWWVNERRKEKKDRSKGLRGTKYHLQINKLQEYIVQHMEYSQYFK